MALRTLSGLKMEIGAKLEKTMFVGITLSPDDETYIIFIHDNDYYIEKDPHV